MDTRKRNAIWALSGLLVVGVVFAVAAFIPSRYTCPEIGFDRNPVRLADGREGCLYLPVQNPPVYGPAVDANERLRWWIAGFGAVLAFVLTPRWWGAWRSRSGVWGSAVPAPPEEFTDDGVEYDGD